MTVIGSGKQITQIKSIFVNTLTRMREQPFSFFVVTNCNVGQYLKTVLMSDISVWALNYSNLVRKANDPQNVNIFK